MAVVKLKIAWIGKTKEPAIESLTNEYLKRLSHYGDVQGVSLRDEAALASFSGKAASGKALSGKAARPQTKHTLVLLDPRGKQFTSEELAGFLEKQELSSLPLLFAVGPADGFSDEMRKSATALLSLGKLTIAHELARVVLLEQLYRACTILKRHPYHIGH
jgi:23S rRNA (pseudouridine1915-N3)-methyltransferase